MNIAICDDNTAFAQQIEKIITDQFLTYNVTCFLSGEELLKSQEAFDLIFLDIKMNDLDGITVAKNIKEKKSAFNKMPVIIFVTCFDCYMPQAFDVHAFHYLLKPIDKDKLIKVINDVVNDQKLQDENEQKSLLLKYKGISTKLFFKDIIYIECYNKKMTIHTTSKLQECWTSMQSMEKMLDDCFFRCHRSYIINLAFVKEYDMLNLLLLDGSNIPMAKQKYPLFVKSYLHYAKNGGIVNV